MPGVRIENRFQAITNDPVSRAIGVHAASLKFARRLPDCDCDETRVCDPLQTRIIVNDLRREIDRLRRWTPTVLVMPPTQCCVGGDARAPGDESVTSQAATDAMRAMAHASHGSHRPGYAATPLGTVLDVRESMAPVIHATQTRFAHVTNHGTLLDVLA